MLHIQRFKDQGENEYLKKTRGKKEKKIEWGGGGGKVGW